MTIRYMGTKGWLAPAVRSIVEEELGTGPRRPIADLFAGTGVVTSELADLAPMVINDSMGFICMINRARFRPRARMASNTLISRLRAVQSDHRSELMARYSELIVAENEAIAAGHDALNSFMRQRAATAVRKSSGPGDKDLVTRYFGGTYFGLSQAIDLDALRRAIDSVVGSRSLRDWALAGWLTAASRIINTPGHGAQYLKATNAYMLKRITRQRQRSAVGAFESQLEAIRSHGSPQWRRQSHVAQLDAREAASKFADGAIVYADPPYTRDHYSRMYHVFETMHAYSFPTVSGAGICPTDLDTSDFSTKSRVESAMRELMQTIARTDSTLLLSYPETGLLAATGTSASEIANEYFSHVSSLAIPTRHSKQGGHRNAGNRVRAVEVLHVCR